MPDQQGVQQNLHLNKLESISMGKNQLEASTQMVLEHYKYNTSTAEYTDSRVEMFLENVWLIY
jgi:hypothetical protein